MLLRLPSMIFKMITVTEIMQPPRDNGIIGDVDFSTGRGGGEGVVTQAVFGEAVVPLREDTRCSYNVDFTEVWEEDLAEMD